MKCIKLYIFITTGENYTIYVDKFRTNKKHKTVLRGYANIEIKRIFKTNKLLGELISCLMDI